MADSSIRFDLFARDRASGVFGAVGKSADKAGGSIGKLTVGFGTLAKVAGGIVIGAGLAKLSGFLRESVAEARESNRVGALTAAVIKSTGGAANVSAKQVSTLATAISNKTAVDDEAIQSGANLLLTFTNVQNRVGKGNDIFNQATQTITDMSAALGQDTKASAIQLGKALNDPIKGVTALSRVGVSFTAQQKTQISTLVASGRTLDAQKVILRELSKEFGGAAAATATPAQKLAVNFGNLKEQIGNKLVPVLDRLATFTLNRVLPAFQAMGAAMSGEGVTSNGFAGFLERIGVAARNVGQWIMGTAVPAFKQFAAGFSSGEGSSGLAKFGAILRGVGDYIQGTVIPVVVKIGKDALPGLKSAFNSVRDAIQQNRPELEKMAARFKSMVDWIVTEALPVLGPILKNTFMAIGKYIGFVIAASARMSAAFMSVRATVAEVLASITGTFLTFVGDFLTGAVRAFGWVPKLGDKLRTAQKEFVTFKDGVNRAIAGITPGKTVTVTAFGRVSLGGGKYTNVPINAATGGYVRGPGGPRSDSIPARLSDGEFVVNAAATRRARPMLEAINAQGYADGGIVARTSSGLGSWPDQFEGVIAAMMTRTAQKLIDASPPLGAGRAGGYGGVVPHLAAVGDLVNRVFGPLSIGGRAGRPGNFSDHPSGHALDFMVGGNKGLGYQIAQFLTAGWSKYSVKYLIWDAMYSGSAGSWGPYSHPLGRTDPTALHRDHVHMSSYLNGGVVDSTGPALVHRGERVLSVAEQRTGGGTTIHIENLTVVTNDPREMVRRLNELARQNGGKLGLVAGAV